MGLLRASLPRDCDIAKGAGIEGNRDRARRGNRPQRPAESFRRAHAVRRVAAKRQRFERRLPPQLETVCGASKTGHGNRRGSQVAGKWRQGGRSHDRFAELAATFSSRAARFTADPMQGKSSRCRRRRASLRRVRARDRSVRPPRPPPCAAIQRHVPQASAHASARGKPRRHRRHWRSGRSPAAVAHEPAPRRRSQDRGHLCVDSD